MARYTSGRRRTTGTYKGRKYNGGSELAAMKMMDKMLKPKKRRRKKSGCYVATCVYGSYDCPQVWTLRRYRDYYLNQRITGRMFIKIYYALSPTFVKLFGGTKWFNAYFRKRLDKKVLLLNEMGISNDPYID